LTYSNSKYFQQPKDLLQSQNVYVTAPRTFARFDPAFVAAINSRNNYISEKFSQFYQFTIQAAKKRQFSQK